MPWRLFGRTDQNDIEPIAVKAKSFLVPIDGSPASLEAVSLACSLARRQKGKVYVIHVIEVPRTLALDALLEPEAAHGEEILLLAEQVAQKAGYDVEGELLQARDAGQALVDEAIARGVELIMLGMEYQQPMGEFQLGRLPQYILKNAPCETWIIRRPPGAKVTK